ncbi:aggregation factor core [Gymnodinialimonas sp.]
MRLIFTCLTIGALSAPAAADVLVRFQEGAPTDRFIFEATGSCPIEAARLTLDLSGSDAGLVFDVTAQGAGVEVFQPFTLVSGADLVTGTSGVTDGDQRLSLDVARLDPGARIAFTIDIDDTLEGSQITVSGAEIAGAQAILQMGAEVFAAPFRADATARIPLAACLS